MFGLSFGEIFVIGIIALIFIGPEELPVIARTIARFLNDLKHSASGLTDELKKQASIDLEPKKMGEQIFDLATTALANKSSTKPEPEIQAPKDGSKAADQSEQNAYLQMKSENAQINPAHVDPHSDNISKSANEASNEISIQAEPLAVPLKPRALNSANSEIVSLSSAETKETVKND